MDVLLSLACKTQANVETKRESKEHKREENIFRDAMLTDCLARPYIILSLMYCMSICACICINVWTNLDIKLIL